MQNSKVFRQLSENHCRIQNYLQNRESDYKDLQYSEWGSLNFDYSKGHVRSFMKSAINFWIENCHFDGIRIDAVSNMIFYDGNKKDCAGFFSM